MSDPHPGVFAGAELVCIRRAIGWAWYGLGGTLGFRRLWRSRARPAAAVDTRPDIYSLASDETYRGGYLITEEPDSPVMVLTVPLPKNALGRHGAARHR